MNSPKKRETRKIAKIMDRISRKDQITDSDVINIMRCTRVIVEATQTSVKYPRTKLFCDWILHSSLTGPQVTFPVLRSATLALRKHLNLNDGINDSMSGVLELERLRQELIEIHGSEAQVHQLFDTFSNWKVFAHFILEDLLDKPIELKPGAEKNPTTKDGKVFQRLVDDLAGDYFVRGFYMKKETRQDVTGIFWAIRLASYADIDTGDHSAELNGGPMTLVDFEQAAST